MGINGSISAHLYYYHYYLLSCTCLGAQLGVKNSIKGSKKGVPWCRWLNQVTFSFLVLFRFRMSKNFSIYIIFSLKPFQLRPCYSRVCAVENFLFRRYLLRTWKRIQWDFYHFLITLFVKVYTPPALSILMCWHKCKMVWQVRKSWSQSIKLKVWFSDWKFPSMLQSPAYVSCFFFISLVDKRRMDKQG